ncbi:hypothetical protein [Pedobacter miscanthi]|uniref:Tetratricopeptide repeat protein n=1 Tax=Pedobacter miscanthi TaxID=2259170 RepID=A0A366KM73_9SPHI|nr:hypothetical protein [Pedobacter miscanthi]RBQ02194.1 hypothetical protein DRW42_27960 [Pedobacter miscanthi]
MALIFEEEDRTVVPNWRDFARTLKLNELANTSHAPLIDINISRAVNDWRNEKNIGVAADLVSSAFISGKTNLPEVDEAIKFVIKNGESTSLITLAKEINGATKEGRGNEDFLGNNIKINSANYDELEYPEDSRLYRLINKTKTQARQQLHNPIPWVELARLYSIFGHFDKADSAMIIAVQLAPNNRFVLRSATRLWAHPKHYDKALYYLRKSQLTQYDPWLISAHIATSTLMKRYSPLLKKGEGIISSKNFSNFDLTELASSIGTFQFNEGAFKQSRSNFDLSIKSPNDNSLAQMEWISKRDGRFDFNLSNFKNVNNTFEAFAIEQNEKGDWEGAFVNTLKWFFDLPYTVRPVLMGSYIASYFLKRQDLAIDLCKAGLKANPNDFTILNNLIYAYALDNRLHQCSNYVDQYRKIKLSEIPNDWKVTFLATNGLIEFQMGNIEFGKKLYENAIEFALKLKSGNLLLHAYINYAKVLINHNCSEKHVVVNRLKELKIDKGSIRDKELFLLREEVLTLYAKNIFL